MSGFLGGPAPRWFTIPAHRPFLEDLADGIWRDLSPRGAEALSEAVVLLPTRRAARSLAQAFLKSAGTRAVLLPRIRTLGDLDEDEAPFEPGDLALELPPGFIYFQEPRLCVPLPTATIGLALPHRPAEAI